MAGHGGEKITEDSSVDQPPFDDDVPMSRFLAENNGFSFPNNQLHIDLTVNDRLPLSFVADIGATPKATVSKVDCRAVLGYKKRLVCKTMLIQKKTKNMIRPEDLHRLRHVHVVACVGTFTHHPTFGLLMYPHAKTDLGQFMAPVSDWLRGEEFVDSHVPLFDDLGHFGWSTSEPIDRIEQLRSFFPCLVEALRYLHQMNVKHKDIKPANILIDRFNSPLLADFDISHRYDNGIDAPTVGETDLTVVYAAPEVLDREPRPLDSDVFSLGCVFSEMITLVMGQNLGDFETYREAKPFGRSIDETHRWLRNLYDPEISSNLPDVYQRANQVIPQYGYRNGDGFSMAVETICTMLDRDPQRRQIQGGNNAEGFRGIVRRTCTECAEQQRMAPCSDWNDLEQRAPESVVRPSATSAIPSPISGPIHLQVPPASGRGARREVPIEVSRSSIHGTESGSTAASRGHSELPSSWLYSSSRMIDQPGPISQGQKLREAIGYDVQERQWKLHKRKDLEGETVRLKAIPIANRLSTDFEGSWVKIKAFHTKVKLQANGRTIAKANISGLPFLSRVRCYLGLVKEVYVIGQPDQPRPRHDLRGQ